MRQDRERVFCSTAIGWARVFGFVGVAGTVAAETRTGVGRAGIAGFSAVHGAIATVVMLILNGDSRRLVAIRVDQGTADQVIEDLLEFGLLLGIQRHCRCRIR